MEFVLNKTLQQYQVRWDVCIQVEASDTPLEDIHTQLQAFCEELWTYDKSLVIYQVEPLTSTHDQETTVLHP